MAEAIENADSRNSTVSTTETDVERTSRLEEANKKLYQRTKEAEANEKKWLDYQKNLQDKPAISESKEYKPSDILKADEFKLYRSGYNESEIDFIMHNGGARALEDKSSPLFLGLEAKRQQRNAEEAASKVNDSTGSSDIERKFTEAQMRAMSKEELAKLLPHTE